MLTEISLRLRNWLFFRSKMKGMLIPDGTRGVICYKMTEKHQRKNGFCVFVAHRLTSKYEAGANIQGTNLKNFSFRVHFLSKTREYVSYMSCVLRNIGFPFFPTPPKYNHETTVLLLILHIEGGRGENVQKKSPLFL